MFPQTASAAASVDKVTLTEQKHNQWDAGSWCSFPAQWPCRRRLGAATRCYEHFHTHTARLPPKNMYSRFFTSCVTSKPKPSPITTCQELPNFLSMDSLIIFAALWERQRRQTHQPTKQLCHITLEYYSPDKIILILFYVKKDWVNTSWEKCILNLTD